MRRNNRNKRPVWSRTAVTATVLGMVLANPAGVLAADSFTPAKLAAASGDAQTNGGAEQAVVKPEAKITRDEAVDILKKLFPEQLKDATPVSVQLGDMGGYPQQNLNVWTVQWEFRTGNSSYGFSSRVDSITGDLIQHDFHMPFNEDQNTYYPPKMNKQQALEAAQAFLHKAAPSLKEENLHQNDQMLGGPAQPLFGPVQYNFYFDVDVNGIKSPSNSLSISVDGNGTIVSFYKNTVQGEYPSPTPKVSKEEAIQAYEKNAEFTLQYVPVRTYNNPISKWVLAWVEEGYAGRDLDAHTGEFVDYTGTKAPSPSWKAVAKKDKVFTPVKGSDNGQLTAEEAIRQAEDQLDIPSDYAINGQYIRPDYNNPGSKVWQLTWMKPQKPGEAMMGDGLSVGIDASTGQIVEYSTNRFSPPWIVDKKEPSAAPITAEQAEAKALEWINLLYPQASEDLKVTANSTPDSGVSQYGFTFRRYYNGIQVGSESASLTLDDSGKLVGYFANSSRKLDEKLKGLEAKISKEQAAELYKKERTVQLQYRTYGGYFMNGNAVPNSVKLVYAMTSVDPAKLGYIVDASTGEWTPSYIDPVFRSGSTGSLPADIKDHWAKEDLTALLEHAVIVPDANGLVHPDNSLKLGDWMNLVMRAASPSFESYGVYYDGSATSIEFQDVKKESPYYSASQFYIQNRWLNPAKTPELHPEKALTREELAVQLIKLVRYEKLSGFMGQGLDGVLDADDISESNRGAVSLAIRLGLLTPDADNRFDPDHVVTTAEAASVLMRVVALQGKLDQTVVYGY